jgi:hypothetical protein
MSLMREAVQQMRFTKAFRHKGLYVVGAIWIMGSMPEWEMHIGLTVFLWRVWFASQSWTISTVVSDDDDGDDDDSDDDANNDDGT